MEQMFCQCFLESLQAKGWPIPFYHFPNRLQERMRASHSLTFIGFW